MATLRTASPSISSLLRTSTTTNATRRCARCLRAQRCPFSSFSPIRQSSKRPLMTETARPQTLDTPLPSTPLGRNAGVPETSIAGQRQEPPSQTWPPVTPWTRQGSEKSAISEREIEAQQSKPTAAQSKPSTTPKKSKLRPRKAPITLTPAALTQLHALAEQPASKHLRVGVKNRGCSGLAYHLEYVEKPGAFDETVEQDGIKVLIDSKALFSIIGSEMDWVEDKLQAKFVFRNPNITEQCGCGESFSIS